MFGFGPQKVEVTPGEQGNNKAQRRGKGKTGNNGGKGSFWDDVDWHGVGGGTGGGALGLLAGKYLADLLYPKSEDPSKDSPMDKAVRAAIMLSVSGAGAYGGYRLMKKAQENGPDNPPGPYYRPETPREAAVGGLGPIATFGVPWAASRYLQSKYVQRFHPTQYRALRDARNAALKVVEDQNSAAADYIRSNGKKIVGFNPGKTGKGGKGGKGGQNSGKPIYQKITLTPSERDGLDRIKETKRIANTDFRRGIHDQIAEDLTGGPGGHPKIQKGVSVGQEVLDEIGKWGTRAAVANEALRVGAAIKNYLSSPEIQGRE